VIFQNFPEDFSAFLAGVPASPVGSCTGSNLINIAFADYSGGIAGHAATEEIIREGVAAIHSAGGLAKLALGGATASMATYLPSPAAARQFAASLASEAELYQLDGVDLDVEDGAAGAEVQVALMDELRRLLGPEFHISYTLPALSGQFEPWADTIRQAADLLDAVNVMAYDYYWDGYTFEQDLNMLHGLGIPHNKVVYGLMPGHHDAGNEYTSLGDAAAAARYAAERGLAGVMTWDANRDCEARLGYQAGEDNLYQTGQGDGVYLNTISRALNNCP